MPQRSGRGIQATAGNRSKSYVGGDGVEVERQHRFWLSSKNLPSAVAGGIGRISWFFRPLLYLHAGGCGSDVSDYSRN
jgi:hypothetical protein